MQMASFMYVRIWKHQRYSFAGKQIHKTWYSWRMEYDMLRKDTENLKTDYPAKEANMKTQYCHYLSIHLQHPWLPAVEAEGGMENIQESAVVPYDCYSDSQVP